MRAAWKGEEEGDGRPGGMVVTIPDSSPSLLPPLTPQFASEEEFEASWQAFVGQTKQKIHLEEAFGEVPGTTHPTLTYSLESGNELPQSGLE